MANARISNIEIIRRPAPGVRFSAALFDFDGTLSLIREGWQQVMTPYFTDVLMETADHGLYETEWRIAEDFIDMLTGKQTIYQCMRLAEEVKKRGGDPPPASEYKNEYLKRLNEKIKDRKTYLKNGVARTEDFLVTGAAEFLNALTLKNISVYLASGTDLRDVSEEAALLNLTRFFGRHIFGAVDGRLDCSKETVVNDIINGQLTDGGRLLGFGDGYVEMELIKKAGGYAVGVASDEKRPYHIDQKKRGRLLDAGADVIVPDFSDTGSLINFLNL